MSLQESPARCSGSPRQRALVSALALGLAQIACVGLASESAGGDGQGDNPAGPGGASAPGRPGSSTNPNPANPGGTPAPGTPGSGGATPGKPGVESAGPLPMRRLTRREYNNVVEQILADKSQPANTFPSDARNEAGFFTPQAVSTLVAVAPIRRTPTWPLSRWSTAASGGLRTRASSVFPAYAGATSCFRDTGVGAAKTRVVMRAAHLRARRPICRRAARLRPCRLRSGARRQRRSCIPVPPGL